MGRTQSLACFSDKGPTEVVSGAEGAEVPDGVRDSELMLEDMPLFQFPKRAWERVPLHIDPSPTCAKEKIALFPDSSA